jgi:hypothetical protein
MINEFIVTVSRLTERTNSREQWGQLLNSRLVLIGINYGTSGGWRADKKSGKYHQPKRERRIKWIPATSTGII